MLKLKPTLLGLLALSNGLAIAGTMGPVCTPGTVSTPCVKSEWMFGGQALYLQPSFSNTDNLFYNNFSVVSPGATSAFSAVYPNLNLRWDWGFEVEGAYLFGHGKDINLNWYRVHNTSTTAQSITSRPPISSYTLGATGSPVAESTSMNPQWDAVNLEFGQRVNLTEMLMLRLHGGFEYARIKTFLNASTVDGSYHSTASMDENGFGPRAGADLSYGVKHLHPYLEYFDGLSVYGKAAAALLAGHQSYATTLSGNGTTGNGNLSPYPSTTVGSHHSVVPELEAKLGLTYDSVLPAWRLMPQSSLTFDFGWMWNTYFNAQSNAYTAAILNTVGGGGFGGGGTATNTLTSAAAGANSFNFSEQGLYFGLKWRG